MPRDEVEPVADVPRPRRSRSGGARFRACSA